MEFLIISGMSGAGKSTAASFLEDMGFYVVDNLPVSLIPDMARLCRVGGRYDRVAIVTDIRGGQTFEGLFSALERLEGMDFPYDILFVEADAKVIIRRYKETRRSHPLAGSTRGLEEAVALERGVLEPVRGRARYLVDTSALSVAKLRGEMLRLFGDGEKSHSMNISVLSFGFKYGLPIEADLVFDARFLPNPFYVESLRDLTGLDEPVRAFLFGYQQTRDFMRHLEGLLTFLLPQFVEEGKAALVIAVGCTGGKHRSVAITRAVADMIRRHGYAVAENHRDMTRA